MLEQNVFKASAIPINKKCYLRVYWTFARAYEPTYLLPLYQTLTFSSHGVSQSVLWSLMGAFPSGERNALQPSGETTPQAAAATNKE
jgi:hypothetical protein